VPQADEELPPDEQATTQIFAMIASLVDSASLAINMPIIADEKLGRSWRVWGLASNSGNAANLVAAKA
jgi:hypothetical protein